MRLRSNVCRLLCDRGVLSEPQASCADLCAECHYELAVCSYCGTRRQGDGAACVQVVLLSWRSGWTHRVLPGPSSRAEVVLQCR